LRGCHQADFGCAASLDKVARILLENHFSHCFVDAVKAGEADAAVAELMETLNFHRELV